MIDLRLKLKWFLWLKYYWFVHVNSRLSEYGVQRGSDGSVSVSDSVLIKVSGADEDNEKEVLVSWSLQVSKLNLLLWLIIVWVVAEPKAFWRCWLGVKRGFQPVKTKVILGGGPGPSWIDCRKEDWLTKSSSSGSSNGRVSKLSRRFV